MRTEAPTIPTGLQYLVQAGFGLTLISTLIGVLFLQGETNALLAALGIMTGALILVETLPRIAEFTVGPIKGKLVKVEKGQQMLRSDLEAIRVALTGIVTKFEIDYLRRLAKAEPWNCRYEPDTYDRLRRLDDMGFVRPTKIHDERRLIRIQELFGDESIKVADREWFNMKDYVEITPAGRNYIELYDTGVKGQ